MSRTAGGVPTAGGYLSLAQGSNGVLYLLGPRGSALRCVAFNEAWLKEGKPVKADAP